MLEVKKNTQKPRESKGKKIWRVVLPHQSLSGNYGAEVPIWT